MISSQFLKFLTTFCVCSQALDGLILLRGTVATEQSHAAAQNLAEAVRSGNYS
jgi:hypothetical protein